jgi:phospholipid/cholesterol/gamma-HCH transport system ATP-binding protein
MRPAEDAFIQFEHVHKSFGTQTVLDDVSLSVRRGRTRVVLGLSGSGKSVLMKHAIGLLAPDRGRVVVDGDDIGKLTPQALLHVRRKFGMVFQQSALFDSMTVAQNVAFPLEEHSRMSRRQKADTVRDKLTLVGLANMAHKFPAELSGGMRKRVALARAIVLEPACVLYDEPTTGLDPLTTDTVDHMILDAQKALSVTSVVISHDIGSALKVADDIAVIDGGRIVADCPASELAQSTHPFVQKFLASWYGKQR